LLVWVSLCEARFHHNSVGLSTLDSAHPYTRAALLKDKRLYGTANGGGPHNSGFLFKMTVD
jgi:uncharacterized repeat protein (TIGR03803 family)